MDYYIGVDIGTSSTRAVAFAEEGSILSKHAVCYNIKHPQPNWSEQDPYLICKAVIDCLYKVANDCASHNPVLISFSTAMHSIIAVDIEGKPLTACIIWADNRAVDIAENLRQTETGKSFYNKTGVPIHAMSPLCKIMWLKENQKIIFNKAHKFIGIKEFVFYNLFGEYIIDKGIASATGLLNIHTLTWDDAVLAFIGIQPLQLSTLVACEHKTYLPANNTHTKIEAFKKTAFVIGGSDGAMANLGSGATLTGTMAVTIGTSGAVRIATPNVYTDEQMRTFCYYLKNSMYITGGASNNGGIVLQWLKENIMTNTDSMDVFSMMANTVVPGSNGLLFLPYILGERAPLWNANAKAVFWGLSAHHQQPHLIRAAMEAVIYNLYSIGKVVMSKTAVTCIYASGGFTKSELWVQILADVFNIKVFVNDTAECAAWGAVLLGKEACGINHVAQPGVMVTTCSPSQSNHAIYRTCFKKFERINELIANDF